ncbi:MAG: hypothetical protein LUM44_08425 [Pyrinomonadaceae bacterium]|nr:hypothetical protein [Pyrinomonadaceae bacterium]
MFKTNISILFIIFIFLFAFSFGVAAQDGSVSAQSSEITASQVPKGAERLLPESVPAEFNQAFDNLLDEGKGKLQGGEREFLVWTGNYKNVSTAARSRSQIETNFRNGGWIFESQGKNGELELFTLNRDSPRRVVLGFFVSDDKVIVCGLMEVFLGNDKSNPQKPITPPKNSQTPSSSNNSPAKSVTVDKDMQWINVMGNEMPPMPDFPALPPKAGRVRGYVKDWTGKPLAGANIGIRSSYLAGYYSGGQGVTDKNGYYELTPPKGMANFYNAGYQIEWGEGIAAVSLHPADGKLDSFVTTDGAVENFVLLPYGITSRENLQENAHLPSTFYGGAIFLSWYSAEADDNNAPPFAVKDDAKLEITLTPEGRMFDGSAGQPIVIRKTAGISGSFRIHNIPLGRYKISIKANGKPLKIKDTKKNDPNFGLSPTEANGEASILFVPGSAKASMVSPQFGAWDWVSLNIETR